MDSNNVWKRCSSCKKELQYNTDHYVCSVSTCNSKRTGLAFCSMPCFDRHLPMARHREADAIQKRSPKKEVTTSNFSEQNSSQGTRRIIRSTINSGTASSSNKLSPVAEKDILIVVSKLKSYIKARSDMNTSANVMDALSNQVRSLADNAIEQARIDGRKTVFDRDFK